MAARTVADVMRREVITIPPTTSVREVASVLQQNRVDGAPVVDDGVLSGIVSLSDVLGLLSR